MDALEKGKLGILTTERMDVFYYYYYLFYLKILKDNEPHMLTTLALSASEGFLINGIIDSVAVTFFCYKVDKWPMIGIVILLVLSNYLFYHRSGRAKRIAIEKPNFFSSNELTLVIVALFFIITISWLFWGSFYSRNILASCF